jgi:hypothetical protein
MSQTTKIPTDRLEAYFGTFTKRFLLHGNPEAADIEVLSPELGDQYVAEGDRLNGITYDPKANALELSLGCPSRTRTCTASTRRRKCGWSRSRMASPAPLRSCAPTARARS